MRRRHLLTLLAGAAAGSTGWPAHAESPPLRLGVAWRGAAAHSDHHVGLLAVDWAARTLRVTGQLRVPTRPHGLFAEADGSLLAVALRPGRWLLRLGADGSLRERVDIDDEALPRRFGGHVIASVDGHRLYTTETDTTTGRGRIGVRDARTLRKIDDWDSHGVEPHQLLLDPKGQLVLANGGIWRDRDDRKIQLHRMEASLVHVHAETGALLGQWRPQDARLSVRHLAWAEGGLLGVALQAEHDRDADQAAAPALAVWNGRTLRTVPGGEGYAGDITGVPGGGLVISNAHRDTAWWWQPAAPLQLTEVAKLQRAYALAAGDGVLIAAGRGLARWHPQEAPAMLPWPQPMALDNHMVTLRA
jgi:uncharacterized protein